MTNFSLACNRCGSSNITVTHEEQYVDSDEYTSTVTIYTCDCCHLTEEV